MSRLYGDRELYGKIVQIAFPIALQNLIIFAVSMADTVMVGMLGELQLSAVSLANQVGFMLYLTTFGLGSGSNVLIAQYWGKKDTDSIHSVLTVMYRILACAAVLFTVFAVVFPEISMSVFTPDPDVIKVGASYLRILGTSYIMMAFCSSTMIVLRSVGAVNYSLLVYLTSVLVNIFFNWMLIFGNLGAPALGVDGAAYATCIARVAEVVLVLVYLIKFEKRIGYRFRYLFRTGLGIAGTFVKNSVPVMINEILWGAGAAVISVIIGHMGTQFTAAYSVCGVLSQLVTIFIFGTGNAAAVIIGNTVGAGQYDLAKRRAKSFLMLSLVLGAVSCLVVLLLKTPLAGIYNISDTARLYAEQIMSVYAVVVIFQSFVSVALIGILRGGGDSRFVLAVDLIFMWLVCIPLGFIAGLKLAWPVPVVYALIKSDEMWKSIAASIRIRRGNWVNDVTKKPA